MVDPHPAHVERFTVVSYYPFALLAAAVLAAIAAHLMTRSLSPLLHLLALIAAAILGVVAADWLARLARR